MRMTVEEKARAERYEFWPFTWKETVESFVTFLLTFAFIAALMFAVAALMFAVAFVVKVVS